MRVMLADAKTAGHSGPYLAMVGEKLNQLGQEVFLVAPSNPLPVAYRGGLRYLPIDGHPTARLHESPKQRLAASIVRGRPTAVPRVGIVLEILETARRQNVDVLHFTRIDDVVFAVAAAGRDHSSSGLKVFGTIHSASPWKDETWRDRRFGEVRASVQRHAYRAAMRVAKPIVVPEFLDVCRDRRIISDAAVVPFPSLLPTDVPIPEPEGARASLGFTRSQPLLLWFGTHRRDKGLALLLDALRLSNDAWQVIAAGPPHEYGCEEAHALVASRRLQDRVRVMCEHVPDETMGELFRAADFVVLPYLSEFAGVTSGLVPIAASLGTPVIATRIPGIERTVSENRLGLVCDPSPTSLAEALAEAFTVRGKHPQELTEGMRRYSESCSVEAVGRRLLNAYEET